MGVSIEQKYQQAVEVSVDIQLPVIAEIQDELLKDVDEVLGVLNDLD